MKDRTVVSVDDDQPYNRGILKPDKQAWFESMLPNTDSATQNHTITKLPMNQTETFRMAIDQYGVDNQNDIAIEEMAELTKALLKDRRYNTPQKKVEVIEEMVDVIIMTEQLKIIYLNSPEARHVFDEFYRKKVDRLRQNIIQDIKFRNSAINNE